MGSREDDLWWNEKYADATYDGDEFEYDEEEDESEEDDCRG